jgi:hypothetical protein
MEVDLISHNLTNDWAGQDQIKIGVSRAVVIRIHLTKQFMHPLSLYCHYSNLLQLSPNYPDYPYPDSAFIDTYSLPVPFPAAYPLAAHAPASRKSTSLSSLVFPSATPVTTCLFSPPKTHQLPVPTRKSCRPIGNFHTNVGLLRDSRLLG